jgi:hypothetical protein
MHNDTPLGATMHLKELDRQATPKLSPLRAGSQEAALVTALRTAMMVFLRRLKMVGLSGRAVSQGLTLSAKNSDIRMSRVRCAGRPGTIGGLLSAAYELGQVRVRADRPGQEPRARGWAGAISTPRWSNAFAASAKGDRGILRIAADLGVGSDTVQRVK